MKRILQFFVLAIAGLSVYVLFGSSCVPKTSIQVTGRLFSRPLEVTVDHELAKLMLTVPSSAAVSDFYSANNNKPLNTSTLAGIASDYSMDVATLYFLQRAYMNKFNRQAQDLYHHFLDQLKSEKADQLAPLKDYYVAFVPGLDYHDSTNGGNFARQRRLLDRGGIQNELIQTNSWGLTDENAALIAKRLNELSALHSSILLVSASKGGLEVAVALGKLMSPGETKAIKAWVSVGGILNGSPVADTYLCWPKCWVAEIGLLTVGQKINLVKDVSYRKRTEDFQGLQFPENVKRIHFVGAPLATQIDKRIRGNYCSIKKFGPNDGITPLADEITDGGIIVSELGFDHYFRHPEIDKKTIALSLVVAAMPK